MTHIILKYVMSWPKRCIQLTSNNSH